MSHEKLKPLDNINDVLIIRKIERKDPSIVTSSNEMIQIKKCSCLESICDCEINLLIEEQEAIVKKQNEMLLADERGKLALLNEIAALKERKESREELLRRRQYALDIEKERARKIASLPPPLPKSVKLLLKQNVSDDEPKLNKPDVQMPNELTAIHITPVEISSKNTENKENIIDPEELEFKQKMHEEWNIKAKQRYYEALKKDRQKEEYSKIMKQIQSAELLKRQEMAKNISADKKGMPCPLSDKFETAKKQVNMEDAADKIFKKSNTKEHVIEDIEGYQDHYEEKYKKIDSTSETKMIDCVPSFVKENYDYLLEDDSKFIGGKNFSGFDDSSSDVLNQAYIETLPGVDELHGTGEIYHEISHWDKLRSSLETEIEQNYKPLLAAAIVEVPKKESKDQAVETDSVSVPAEDKAVETDAQLKNDQSSPSPLAAFNFINAGVMAHKRRPRLPVMSTYEEIPLPDMHQRDVHYVMPSVPESKDLIESWSPSTYCSLPSKHGLSALPNGSKSAVCDICVAEKKKDQIKDNFIQETTATFQLFNEEKYRNLNSPSEKIPLSEFVQQLAKKHLETNSIKNYQQSKNITKSFGDSTYSNTKIINPAFEKEIIGKSKVGIFNEPIKSPINEFISVSSKNALPEEEKKFWTSPLVVEKLLPATKTETSIKVNESKKDMIESEESQDNIYFKIKDNELQKSPNEYSEYDYEAKRIQAIHQVLSRNFPQFSFEDNGKKEDKNSSKEAKQFTSVQNEIIAKPHVYHDLSTIQEVDSALTASSLQLSQSKLSDTSKTRGEKDVPQEEKLKDLDQSTEKLKIVSLLDPPDTEITELAKSIHFVPETEKKMNHSLETSKTAFTNSSTDKSTSSKIHSSTPTLSSGSYSFVSVSTPSLLYSGSSCPSVSAESKVNENNQDVIISGYISGSEIQGMSESEVLNSKQDEKDMNTVVSGYISEMDETQVSTDNISNLKKEMNQRHSAVSKFGDQEIQHLANSGISNLISEKNNMHPVTSKYLNDLIMPKMTKTGISHFYHENEGNKQFTKDDSMISNSTSHGNDSLKFLPLTPHSDVSSPNTYNDTNYSLLKFGDFKKITSNNVNFLKTRTISNRNNI